MSKYNLILKKANLFERLAIFGFEDTYQDIYEKTSDSLSIKPDPSLVKEWLNLVLPDIIIRYMVEPCELKKCGTISQKIVDLAQNVGLNAIVEDTFGHAVALIKVENGTFRVDATHLQSLFPYHGSLRDFDREEREEDEFKKMKNLFDELKNNPMKAVKIDFYENS